MGSAKRLKRVIDGVNGLVAQANIDCTPHSMDMQAMDSSHVALCSLKLHAVGFDSYKCDNPITIGINVGQLSKVLKCAEAQDGVELSTDGDAEMRVDFVSQDTSRSSNFVLRLIELDVETLEIPDIEYDCEVNMPSSEFQRIIRELAALGEGELGADTLAITADSNGVTFAVDGDGGHGSFHYTNATDANGASDADSIQIKVSSSCASRYGMQYLVTFAKAAVDSRIRLCMSAEAPMRVEYPIDDLGYLRFYLAPKMEMSE